MNFKDLNLIEIIELIKDWKNTKEEIFDYFIKRIEKYNDKISAFNFINKEWLNTVWTWALFWAPLALSDLFCEKWILTTASSKMLEDFRPPYNSSVVERLLLEWMSSIWKSNLKEFTIWSVEENLSKKESINPYLKDKKILSSDWWASAVSAWLAPALISVDVWWWLRQSAAECNLVWFKPSYWRISRYWTISIASSLDTVWTLTKTVKDSAFLYELLNGEDHLDTTSLAWKEKLNSEIWNKKDLKWYKIWFIKEFFWDDLEEDVRKKMEESFEKLKELWAELIEVSIPSVKYALASYLIISWAELSTNLWKYDWIKYWHVSNKAYESIDEMYVNNRTEWLWDVVKKRIMLWNYVLLEDTYEKYFKKATQVRTMIIKELEKAFEGVDAIAWPINNIIWEEENIYTIPSSLAWIPWISIPAWFAEDKPIGLHIIASKLQEEKLFEIAYTYEQATKFWKENLNWFED